MCFCTGMLICAVNLLGGHNHGFLDEYLPARARGVVRRHDAEDRPRRPQRLHRGRPAEGAGHGQDLEVRLAQEPLLRRCAGCQSQWMSCVSPDHDRIWEGLGLVGNLILSLNLALNPNPGGQCL